VLGRYPSFASGSCRLRSDTNSALTAEFPRTATRHKFCLRDGLTVRLYSGRQAIQQQLPALIDLGRRSRPPGAAEYLPYFLGQPYTGGKIPHLLLFYAPPNPSEPARGTGTLIGAVLVHEYRRFHTSLGLFVTEDYGGERNIIAAQELQSDLALHAAEYLLRSHAHLVLISLRDGVFRAAGTGKSLCGAGSGRWLHTSSSRTLKRRLLLARDYDGTLATLGAHTRRNLRAYRRRAEAALGCSFVPCAEISETEFLALNGVCAYPTPEFVASWRYRTARSQPGGVFSGLRAQDGRWLSLLGGRRAGDTLSIDWQLNRVEFESLSL